MTFWLVQGPNRESCLSSDSYRHTYTHTRCMHTCTCAVKWLPALTQSNTFARSLSFSLALTAHVYECVCVYALYCVYAGTRVFVCMRFVAESRLEWTDKWWVEWSGREADGMGRGMGAWLSRPCQSACLLISRSATHKKRRKDTGLLCSVLFNRAR